MMIQFTFAYRSTFSRFWSSLESFLTLNSSKIHFLIINYFQFKILTHLCRICLKLCSPFSKIAHRKRVKCLNYFMYSETVSRQKLIQNLYDRFQQGRIDYYYCLVYSFQNKCYRIAQLHLFLSESLICRRTSTVW